LLVAAEISGAVRGLGPFGRVVKAPILAVDIKMIVIPAFALMALGQLGVARELVAQTDEPVIPFKAPRVVLERTKIKSIERGGASLARKRRIVQLRRAVLLAEEKTERVLGISRAPAVSAANAE